MTEIKVWADTETKSEADLRVVGTARYAEHPSTDIQLFSYAFNDGPVKVWSKEDGEPMPADLKAAFANPKCIFWFHNAFFDRNIIENVLDIKLPIQRYRCSMAQALSHALPGSLDKLGEVLGIREDARKVKDGKRLVLKFCRPKKLKDGTLKWATPQTDPEDWAAYKEYCRTDTAAMREIVKKMPSWNYPKNPTELELWYLDQEVNSRGMYIDLELANAAMLAIDNTQKELAKSTHKMTNGDVETAGQRDAMLKHIVEQYGVALPDMRKATLERLVENDETPPALRELLQVRLSTCTTSTAKYKKFTQVTSVDSRVRGTIQFAGASRTLRDGGRMVQPQNFFRPTLPHQEILDGIDSLIGGYAELIGLDIMTLTSSALRYAICAPKGKKLVVADLAGIENRVLSYLAGEEWKLQAFRDLDDGTGPDLYKAAYAKAFAVAPTDVTKDQRQVGKVIELSCGYGGGCGAIVAFATGFGIDLDYLASCVLPSVPQDVLKDADSFYDWLDSKDTVEALTRAKKDGSDLYEHYTGKRTFGLKKDTHMALESLKRLWRREHPATVSFWKETDVAFRNAIATANTKFYFGKCYALRSGKWVRIVLPSGHNLCYPGARINGDDQIVFKGVDQFTKKWGDIKTYGPKLVENIVQAFSRDIFKFGQLNAAAEGFDLVLPVHDELVTEVPDTEDFTVHHLEEIMATVPPWAEGIPLAAEGFSDYRYHK